MKKNLELYNSQKKKKEWKENNIRKTNCRKYFMELLGDTEMGIGEEVTTGRYMTGGQKK